MLQRFAIILNFYMKQAPVSLGLHPILTVKQLEDIVRNTQIFTPYLVCFCADSFILLISKLGTKRHDNFIDIIDKTSW